MSKGWWKVFAGREECAACFGGLEVIYESSRFKVWRCRKDANKYWLEKPQKSGSPTGVNDRL